MCGICGIVNAEGHPRSFDRMVDAMTTDLERRGPDDLGRWSAALDTAGQAGLGFRRLAIIDPTPAGAQPMWSRERDAVLVFNGEIYNHREIGRTLEAEGVTFRSNSDTEVLLEALRRWDTDALAKLRGMFAFGFYRPASRQLLLARDHAGIKPLFFARQPGGAGLAFSSRYDSLFRTGWLDVDRYDHGRLAEYIERRHVGGTGALHVGAGQVGAGEWLRAGADGIEDRRTWWSLEREQRELAEGEQLSGRMAIEATAEALDRSVRRHLIADVPVGVFLSGGVDSPLVAGTATEAANRSFDGFTIGFPDWPQDETAAATSMAGPLNIDHHAHLVGDLEPSTVASLLAAMDEPVNDWSLVPTLLVSEAARKRVTVALSGDGGDELFFGYDRSWSVTNSWRLWPLPPLARRAINKGKRQLGRRAGGAVEHANPTAYYNAMQASSSRETLAKVAPGLATSWDARPPAAFTERPTLSALAHFSQRREFTLQLPRVLRKVDQASMQHSLEVRVPLLDRDVISVALKIDPAWTMSQPDSKPVLRQLLDDRLGFPSPKAKLGFGAPIADWMAGPLREPMTEALSRDIAGGGIFDPTETQRFWREQLSGAADNRQLLWGLACLGWWHERVATMATTNKSGG